MAIRSLEPLIHVLDPPRAYKQAMAQNHAWKHAKAPEASQRPLRPKALETQ